MNRVASANVKATALAGGNFLETLTTLFFHSALTQASSAISTRSRMREKATVAELAAQPGVR